MTALQEVEQYVIKTAYLNPFSKENMERIAAKLDSSPMGATLNLEPAGGRERNNIWRLRWWDKQEDFKAITVAIEYIVDQFSVLEPDEPFTGACLETLQKILLENSPSMRALCLAQHPRQSRDTFSHTFDVINFLLLADLPLEEQIEMIIEAILHDVGKLFNITFSGESSDNLSLDADPTQDHAILSVLFLYEYVRSDPKITSFFTGEQVVLNWEQIANVIRLHHLPQVLDQDLIDLDAIAQYIVEEKYLGENPRRLLLHWVRLAIADVASVRSYEEFIGKNISQILKLCEQICNILDDEELYLEIERAVSQAIVKVVNELVQFSDQTEVEGGSVSGVEKLSIARVVHDLFTDLEAYAAGLLQLIGQENVKVRPKPGVEQIIFSAASM